MSATDEVNKKNEAFHREMARKANDEILIYNPTHEIFQIRYGGYIHTVPEAKHDIGYGPGCIVVARYLALHYCKHMIDKLITEESNRIVADAKRKYRGTRWPEEELRVALRTSNPELRKKYLLKIWKGVKRRFGLDETPVETGTKSEDVRPVDEQLIETLEKEINKPTPETPKEVTETVKEEFAEEIKE
jgi:hypothetical protein